MTRIELKNIADPIGQKLAPEQNLATLDATIAEAARTNNVDPLDYTLFKSEVLDAKNLFWRLGKEKLPSAVAAFAGNNSSA